MQVEMKGFMSSEMGLDPGLPSNKTYLICIMTIHGYFLTFNNLEDIQEDF